MPITDYNLNLSSSTNVVMYTDTEVPKMTLKNNLLKQQICQNNQLPI